MLKTIPLHDGTRRGITIGVDSFASLLPSDVPHTDFGNSCDNARRTYLNVSRSTFPVRDSMRWPSAYTRGVYPIRVSRAPKHLPSSGVQWASVPRCPYHYSRHTCGQPVKMLPHTFATYGFGQQLKTRVALLETPCPRTFHSLSVHDFRWTMRHVFNHKCLQRGLPPIYCYRRCKDTTISRHDQAYREIFY